MSSGKLLKKGTKRKAERALRRARGARKFEFLDTEGDEMTGLRFKTIACVPYIELHLLINILEDILNEADENAISQDRGASDSTK